MSVRLQHYHAGPQSGNFCRTVHADDESYARVVYEAYQALLPATSYPAEKIFLPNLQGGHTVAVIQEEIAIPHWQPLCCTNRTTLYHQPGGVDAVVLCGTCAKRQSSVIALPINDGLVVCLWQLYPSTRLAVVHVVPENLEASTGRGILDRVFSLVGWNMQRTHALVGYGVRPCCDSDRKVYSRLGDIFCQRGLPGENIRYRTECTACTRVDNEPLFWSAARAAEEGSLPGKNLLFVSFP